MAEGREDGAASPVNQGAPSNISSALLPEGMIAPCSGPLSLLDDSKTTVRLDALDEREWGRVCGAAAAEEEEDGSFLRFGML